jgi:hypothetical protein
MKLETREGNNRREKNQMNQALIPELITAANYYGVFD